MTEQTNDPLADEAREALAANLDAVVASLLRGGQSEGYRSQVALASLDYLRRAAAVIRASGAGLGGTTREQIARALMEWAGDEEDEFSQAWLGAADAVLALRPDPAPDDTTEDGPWSMEDGWRVWQNTARLLAAERDAARADLAARDQTIAALREFESRLHEYRYATDQPELNPLLRDLRALLGGTPNQHRERRPVQKKWKVKYDPVQQLWHLTDPEGRWVSSWHRERWQSAIDTAQLMAVFRYSRSGR